MEDSCIFLEAACSYYFFQVACNSLMIVKILAKKSARFQITSINLYVFILFSLLFIFLFSLLDRIACPGVRNFSNSQINLGYPIIMTT